MKKWGFLVALILPLFAQSQIICPAFGRLQNYEKWEVFLTWNTVDPFSSLANIHLDDDHDPEQTGSDYENKSIAPGITFNYYADDITVLRLKMIYTKRDIHSHIDLSDTLGNFYIDDTQFDQTLFKIAPGFQWTYFVSRFSFYGGFELPYTYQEEFTQTQYVLDSSTVNQTRSEGTSTLTIPAGYSVGLGCFGGTTFYFERIFGIGFEVSSAFQYSKLGGTITIHSESTDDPPVIVDSEFNDQSKLWKFSPVQASMHLSVRF